MGKDERTQVGTDWLSVTADPRSAALELAPRVDVSRLDLRVGQILSGRQHPLSTAMTVLEVDVGEKSPRTVVCRLGTATPLEEVMHPPDRTFSFSFINA